MSDTQRMIFRERARQFYLQRYQPDVLPRFISYKLFLAGWFLLVLLLFTLIVFLFVFGGFLKG